MPSDYSVSQNLLVGHSKVGGLMNYKAVDFDKGARINKSVDSLPRGHLSPRMLRLYLLRSAAELRLFSFLLQLIEPLSHAHWFEECEAIPCIKAGVDSSRSEASVILRSLSELF